MKDPVIIYIGAKDFCLNYFFFILFFLLILVSIKSNAQGDLLLYPKRVVFEGTKRSQTLNLANTGKDTVRFLISVIQTRMREDGGFENINQPDSGQFFADKYFRFFPRSVVLAPNEAQTVKIQLINSNEMLPGEYRSHLFFRSEPEKKPLGYDGSVKDTSSISVNLVAVFGISIPVIIRVGECTTRVTLSDVSLESKKDSMPSLKVTMNRSGSMSVYGDVWIDHTSPEGKVTRVGLIKGLALYTPNDKRYVHIALNKIFQ
ncbi:MAG: hypothetical protein WKI04_15435 [Ferruginibacter sp.]